MSREVPANCWATAAIDPAVDFSGVRQIFGYGSLVWKPPCDVEMVADSFPATIVGWRRRFWQRSVDHRGTPEHPGRVCTIMRDNHPDLAGTTPEPVTGMVYEIKEDCFRTMLEDLDYREKNGYTRTVVTYTRKSRNDSDGLSGRAIIYYAQPGHDPAYNGAESLDATAAVIARSIGPSGHNSEYFFNLLRWVDENGLHDPYLSQLSGAVIRAQQGRDDVSSKEEQLSTSAADSAGESVKRQAEAVGFIMAKKRKSEPALPPKPASSVSVLGAARDCQAPATGASAASAFGDSSSEEEEMPVEARQRLRNKGKDTPTSAGPNSFNKRGSTGFVDPRTKDWGAGRIGY